MKPKRIAIGSDHAGYESKEAAKREIVALGVEVDDKGTNSLESVDYPDFGAAVGRAVASGEDDRAGRWEGFEKNECGIHTFLGQSI